MTRIKAQHNTLLKYLHLFILFLFLLNSFANEIRAQQLKTIRISTVDDFEKGFFNKVGIDSLTSDGALQLATSDENLALEREAICDIESSSPSYDASNITDGSKSTFWYLGSNISVLDHYLQVDLGALRSIDHVVIYTYLYENNTFPVAGYTLSLSETGEEGSWIQVIGSNESTPLIDTTFTAHTTRYVRLTFTKANPGGTATMISEFEVYGSGYSPSGYWISEKINLPKSNFQGVSWRGNIQEGTSLSVHFRSDSTWILNYPVEVAGDTVYLPFRHVMAGTENFTKPDGTSLSGYYFFKNYSYYEDGFFEYDPAGISQGDTILVNYKIWSEWSPVSEDTSFALHLPEPRQNVQARVNFSTSTIETPSLDEIELYYHDILLIDSVYSSVSPDTINVLELDTLTCTLNLFPAQGNLGIDTLRIYTPSPPELQGVYLDGIELRAPDEITTSVSLRSVNIAFNQTLLPQNPVKLDVVFTVTLFSTLSSFPAVLINSSIPDNPQWVDESPELFRVVTTGIPEKVLLKVEVAPNPFTPNGDNICDLTSINFFVTKLAVPRRVKVSIYNLNGNRLTTLYDQYQVASPFQIIWDGRVNGDLLPPGAYICEIQVNTDSGLKSAYKPIVIAY